MANYSLLTRKFSTRDSFHSIVAGSFRLGHVSWEEDMKSNHFYKEYIGQNVSRVQSEAVDKMFDEMPTKVQYAWMRNN